MSIYWIFLMDFSLRLCCTKYGLILPKKNQISAPKSGNVFGDDDDSDEEIGTDWVKKTLQAENEKNKIKRQTKLNLRKALEEDPTIFQYDEVYSEIERIREKEKPTKQTEKKPKYIFNLLKSAELRKKEQELRKDRIIQKEIEAENAIYGDKERFITSSYKKKLEEMKDFKEELEYQDQLEKITDVTKQKDMSGFYRHLYRQTVEGEKVEKNEPIKDKVIEKNQTIINAQLDIDKDDEISSESESGNSRKSDDENEKNKETSSSTTKVKKRHYRKRALENLESESDEEEKEKDEKEKLSKIDSKENSIVIENEAKQITERVNEKEKQTENEKVKYLIPEKRQKSEKDEEKILEDSSTVLEKSEKVQKERKEERQQKKVSIWLKRTVGAVFEAKLKTYLEYKEKRQAAGYYD